MGCLRYKSKVANEKHGNLLVSLSEKIVWGVLGVPITFLAKTNPGQFTEWNWFVPYIIIGGVMGILAIYLQKVGLCILDNLPSEK